MPSAYAALHQPFQPDWIEKWDGAFLPEHREACLWLYEAIVADNANLVRGILRLGARVNTQLRDGAIHKDLYSRSPLNVALFLATHYRTDDKLGPLNADGSSRKDSGVVQALLEGGATPLNRIGHALDQAAWEDVQHPLFVQLETAALDRLAGGDLMYLTSQEDCDRDRSRAWNYYRSSVVADHPAHNPHLWLHRAILRQRWDVLDVWWDQHGTVGVEDGDSALALLWWQRFRTPLPDDTPAPGSSPVPAKRPKRLRPKGRLAPVPVSPTFPPLNPISDRVLHRELAHLRPALLAAHGTVYRQEVIATLALALGPSAPADASLVTACLTWVDALLKERPLASFALMEEDVADRRRLSPLALPRVREHLVGVEQQQLRRSVPSRPTSVKGPGTAPSPARRRL